MTLEQQDARKRFGRRLALWRESRGLSQMEVALRLERSQSYVSKWETGIAAEFTPEELRAFADAIEMPPLELLIAGEFVLRGEVGGTSPPLTPEEQDEVVGAMAELLDLVGRETDRMRGSVTDWSQDYLRRRGVRGTG